MTRVDFARQFNQEEQRYSHYYFIGIISFVIGFLLLILPSSKSLRLYNPPSSYQSSLKNYLNLLSSYDNPENLPRIYEDNLRQATQKALVLASESQIYYPNNKELLDLTIEVKNQAENKFPDLIAKAN